MRHDAAMGPAEEVFVQLRLPDHLARATVTGLTVPGILPADLPAEFCPDLSEGFLAGFSQGL